MKSLALLAAAASWSAPQTVSTPHPFAAPLLVSSDQHGGALAAWGWQNGIGQQAATGASQVRVSTGAVSAEQPALDGLVAAQAYGNGHFVELANRQVDKSGRRWRLTVRDGSRSTRLTTAFILFRPQLAVAPDGSAIVAWVEFHNGRQIVRISTRNGTGQFSRPVTLDGRAHAATLATAISKRRDALVAYVSDRRVIVRLRRPGGGWSARHVVSSARVKTSWQLAAAFSDLRRGVVVWRRHRFSRPGVPGITPLAAASIGRADTRWGAAQSIEADGARDPALALGPAHGLVLSYIHGPNSSATARLRQSGRSGRFGPPQDGAPPQGGVTSVSAVFDGAFSIFVGWVIPNPSGDGGGIGYAADVTTLGPREQVTPNEATFDMQLVRTAVGRVRAFWTARPDGTGPGIPVSQLHTVVRTALRVPPTP